MPIAALASLLPAVSGAQTSGIGAITGLMDNAVNFKLSQNQYKRERRDNIDFWNMQNQYNSPQAQMERYQAAGLNPNLIYGQQNTSGPISTPRVDIPQARTQHTPYQDTGGLAMMNAMYDLEMKQAQTDNLRAQNGVIQEDRLLKQTQRRSIGLTGDMTEFDLGYKSEMRSTSADAQRERLRQMRLKMELDTNRDSREAASSSAYLQQAIENLAKSKIERARTYVEIQRIKQQMELAKEDIKMKQLDNRLREAGFNPNSPTWELLIGRALTNFFDSPSASYDTQKFLNTTPNNWFNSWFK